MLQAPGSHDSGENGSNPASPGLSGLSLRDEEVSAETPSTDLLQAWDLVMLDLSVHIKRANLPASEAKPQGFRNAAQALLARQNAQACAMLLKGPQHDHTCDDSAAVLNAGEGAGAYLGLGCS